MSELTQESSDFVVKLDNFEGPFDLLLQLISRRKLDVTEVALSQVTDEFIATVLAASESWDLEQTSSFLVVAATLLDLKTARLLPSGEVEDEEDIAILEARDLLFAKLLQYRAFKKAAEWVEVTMSNQVNRVPRPGGLEPEFTALLPEPVIAVSWERFAQIVANLLAPKPALEISLAHLHSSKVSVSEQARHIADTLRRSRVTTFRSLTAQLDRTTTVARFLALLEMFRQRLVSFEQLTPLGELTIRWTGDDQTEVEIVDEYDNPSE